MSDETTSPGTGNTADSAKDPAPGEAAYGGPAEGAAAYAQPAAEGGTPGSAGSAAYGQGEAAQGRSEGDQAAHGAEGVPGAGPWGPQAPGHGQIPPGQYGQYPGYGQPYWAEQGTVRSDVKRLFRHRVVQFIGAGLIGAVIGGGAVATVGAFVWDHDNSGPRWQNRGGITQQFPGGGGGFGGGLGGNFGSDNGNGTNGNGNGNSGTGSSGSSGSGGGVIVQP